MRKTLAPILLAATVALTGCGAISDDSPQGDDIHKAQRRLQDEGLTGTLRSQLIPTSEALCKARADGVDADTRVEILVDNGPGWTAEEARFVDRVIGEEIC